MEANGGAGGAEGAHGRESSSHAAAARLHASLQLASVYVHPTECGVAAGIVAGSLSACRARSLARRRLLLALASSLGVLYAAKNAVCYGIALLFETTLDPAAGAGVLEELESKMAAKRFHVKPRKEKRASWSPFGRKKAAEAPPVTLSLSRENLRRLFDELDVDKSGALDAQEVRRLIERYFAATVSIFRESSPRLFHKAGLADCSEEELLPEKVLVPLSTIALFPSHALFLSRQPSLTCHAHPHARTGGCVFHPGLLRNAGDAAGAGRDPAQD